MRRKSNYNFKAKICNSLKMLISVFIYKAYGVLWLLVGGNWVEQLMVTEWTERSDGEQAHIQFSIMSVRIAGDRVVSMGSEVCKKPSIFPPCWSLTYFLSLTVLLCTVCLF